MELLGWGIHAETLVIGALTGLAYAVLAAGLVLVYRATRVVNFAHGEIGAFGAAVLAKLVLDHRWNFFLALALVLVIGAAMGAIVELAVVRRLFHAPRLVLLVATIGVAQLVFVLQLVLPGVDQIGPYPSPMTGTVQVGTVFLRSEHFMVLGIVPVIIGALAFLLTRTPYGIAIRAAAENPDRAELCGISTKRVSTMVWVLAGLLATLTVVVINPLRGTIVGLPSMALGPSLLLRALVAAMVGGMVSLPRTLVGGLLVGVVEAVMFVNVANAGAIDAIFFAAVLVLVLARRSGADEDAGSWSLSPRVKAIPGHLAGVWWIKHMSLLATTSGVGVAVLLPLIFDTSARSFMFTRVVLFAIIALSVTVLTGWAGQLSLGQFAFVGLGAMVAGSLVNRGMPFGYAVAYATIAGVVAALLIGFPALRVRGLFLAVTTLAFAVAARGWLLSHERFLGDGTIIFLPRGEWLGIDFTSQRSYYYMCLVVFIGCVFVVSRLRASGIGRTIIAVRENERAAASFTVAPVFAKLTAFAVSGGLASLAGALLAGLQVQYGPDAFPPEESLRVVAMTVIGGLGSVSGAVLGAVYVVGLPALFGDNQTIGLVTSGVGLLVLLLYLPGGLAQVLYRGRDALLSWLDARVPAERRERVDAVARRASLSSSEARIERAADVPALSAEGVTVRFGGRVAVDNVAIEARPGEVVGLIGSNGAGKSTLMNVISGFVRPERGTIEIFGRDVSRLPPHDRAAAGMGRVFQDARLFGDLTVQETVKVALEGRQRSELVPSILGLAPARRAERAKIAESAEYISFLGLGRYADAFLSDLSTGTRRIVELCCLLAQGSDLLLLDEPTAGVAQRETEAFAPLITRIQRELGATILIIEHDIPLVMGMSDHVYCLTAGQVIAHGLPDEVRTDPRVVSAYLGTDERAIHRSGAAVDSAAGPMPSSNGIATETPVDLHGLKRDELLTFARMEGIAGTSRMCKDDLVAALEAVDE